MADLLDVIDNLCLGLNRRGTQPVTDASGVETPGRGLYVNEWQYAQAGAFMQFRTYFVGKYGGGLVVGEGGMGGLDENEWRKALQTNDRWINFFVDAMRDRFRNWWSKKNASRPGGFRKPDGMGISPGGKVIELIEVKPHYMYADGKAQLDESVEIVRNALTDHYNLECIKEGRSIEFNPVATQIRAAEFRPKHPYLSIPIVTDPKQNEIAWVCYKPTLRLLPSGAMPAAGVVLYEIHNVDRRAASNNPKALPPDLVRRLREAHAKRVQPNGPQLVPWAVDYANQNKKDMEDLSKLILVLGAIVLVALLAEVIVAELTVVAVVAPESAVVLGETVEVMVGGSYRVAPQLLRVAAAEYEAAESAEVVVEVAKRRMVMRP